MVPFLDPGSEIYDNPESWGYTIFHHSLEDHKNALLCMNWKNRLNYETNWLSRDEIVNVSYDAVEALTLLKNKYGLFSDGITQSILNLIDQTRALLKEIDKYQMMENCREKERIFSQLKQKIADYNRNQFSKVRSQQRPVDLGFSKQQWFDTDEAFSRVLN
jgi:clorobiocin biosynthesis protein CloN6